MAPYAGALGVYVIFRVRALGGFAPFSGTLHRLTPWQNFLSVPVLIAQYVLKLLWPTRLNYYYHFIPQSAPGWEFFASVLLISALVRYHVSPAELGRAVAFLRDRLVFHYLGSRAEHRER